jgi:DNA-binding GntR family transcriptional regulator
VSITTGAAESAGQRAHRVIRDRILDGTYRGGTMLSENAIAADLGISRTPVRAALLRLEEDGFVTIYPKRGALVRTFTRQDAEEIASARHLLESGGVQAASPRTLEALCTRLDALVDTQYAAVRDGDRESFVAQSLQFHRALVEVGGNRLLLEFADRLQGRQGLLLRLSLAAVHAHDDDVVDEHRQLVAALRRRDFEAFSTLLRTHMSDSPAHSGLA